jgi:hypothetical protein
MVREGKLRTSFSNVVVTFWKVFQSMQLYIYIWFRHVVGTSGPILLVV